MPRFMVVYENKSHEQKIEILYGSLDSVKYALEKLINIGNTIVTIVRE